MLNNSVTMVTITSSANSSLRQLRTFNSENRTNHPRDASFSSYLNGNGDTFGEKLAESSRHLNHFTSNKEDHLGEKKEEEGQIGVFEAQKYFNGGMDECTRVANMAARQYQYQKDEHIALENRKYKIQSGTPSIRSESSWNSQSALLQNSLRNSSRNRKSKVQGKSFLAGLGCKCSCTDKNSVDISDHSGETATHGVVRGKKTPKNLFNTGLDANYSVKINKPHEELLFNKDVYFKKPEKLELRLNRENGSPFSTVNSGLRNQLVNIKLQQEEEEKPRKSLEVFGSPILDKRRSLTFDKRLTRPSWDAAPKMEEIDFSANSAVNYNDTESDASSDLFEIESLAGKSNPFLARQTSDVTSGCVTPTTGYAPSEASIEWSVATASAVEYSALSDNEEQRSVATIRSPIKPAFTSSNGRTKASKEMQRGNPSMLLGCKSHKAVRVAGDAFITYEKARSSPHIRRRSDTLTPVTTIKTETKLGNFGAIHGQHAYATPPLQHSHSSHASQPLYI